MQYFFDRLEEVVRQDKFSHLNQSLLTCLADLKQQLLKVPKPLFLVAFKKFVNITTEKMQEILLAKLSLNLWTDLKRFSENESADSHGSNF